MDDLLAYALEVATKAARNIGGTIREVGKRTKSQAYLYGALRRRFPAASEDAIRNALHWLRHDAPDADFTTTPRRPTLGREPASDACWAQRAAQLAQVVECSSPEELLDLARARLSWRRNFTIQVLVAAEDAGLLVYEAHCWARSNEMTKSKLKTIRIERTLPCHLTPEESHQASMAAAEKLLERERLEAKLRAVTAELRARIKESQKELYRLLLQSAQQKAERPVECEQRINYRLGTCEIVRLDTGEIVEARALTPDERQLELGAVG
jgi:hypothetical protein